MSKSTDERRRLNLPKDIRERFGDRYRIVELPSHVALFPVDDDPVDGIRAAVGDAFEGSDVDALKADARDSIFREIEEETRRRSSNSED